MASPAEAHGHDPSANLARNEHPMTASLYAELHRMAAARMRNERRDHTLQPTALVNEAYLRLEERGGSLWGHRSEVLGVAGRVMRNVLVDHARARQADKRGGGAVQVELEDGMALAQGSLVDVLAVDEALSRLAQLDQRQARMIEMHIFGRRRPRRFTRASHCVRHLALAGPPNLPA